MGTRPTETLICVVTLRDAKSWAVVVVGPTLTGSRSEGGRPCRGGTSPVRRAQQRRQRGGEGGGRRSARREVGPTTTTTGREAADARQDDNASSVSDRGCSHPTLAGSRRERDVVQGTDLAGEAGPTTTAARRGGRRPTLGRKGGSRRSTRKGTGGAWGASYDFNVGEGRF